MPLLLVTTAKCNTTKRHTLEGRAASFTATALCTWQKGAASQGNRATRASRRAHHCGKILGGQQRVAGYFDCVDGIACTRESTREGDAADVGESLKYERKTF